MVSRALLPSMLAVARSMGGAAASAAAGKPYPHAPGHAQGRAQS